MSRSDEILLRAVREPKNKRRDIATLYACLISQYPPRDGLDPHWTVLNQAIIDRWSTSGLSWIKDRAWEIASGSNQESRGE